ncbi:MAG: hypothetical protein QM765_30335 [Myxococcales bacterium]
MSFVFNCPYCQAPLPTRDSPETVTVKCEYCGKRVQVDSHSARKLDHLVGHALDKVRSLVLVGVVAAVAIVGLVAGAVLLVAWPEPQVPEVKIAVPAMPELPQIPKVPEPKQPHVPTDAEKAPGLEAWGGPTRFDASAFLAEATRRAKAEMADAQLYRIDVPKVGPSGLVDLTLERERHPTVMYRFRSVERSKAPAGTPRGTDPRVPCEYYVTVDAEGIDAHVVEENLASCNDDLLQTPLPCNLADLWKAAVKLGAPIDAVASLTLRVRTSVAPDAPSAGTWDFSIREGSKTLFERLFTSRCEDVAAVAAAARKAAGPEFTARVAGVSGVASTDAERVFTAARPAINKCFAEARAGYGGRLDGFGGTITIEIAIGGKVAAVDAQLGPQPYSSGGKGPAAQFCRCVEDVLRKGTYTSAREEGRATHQLYIVQREH